MGRVARIAAFIGAAALITPPSAFASADVTHDVPSTPIVQPQSTTHTALARGLILTPMPGGRTPRARGEVKRRVDAALMVTSVETPRGSESTSTVLAFDSPRGFSEVQDVADQLMRDGLVAFAEPDLVLHPAASVRPPNDPQFEDQWHLHDGGGSADYSVDALSGWPFTTGSPEVVVAVLDTGWTEHPDLETSIINGYDFISDRRSGNDGNGRDADARDPGDWVDSSDYGSGFSGCDISESSWHGTHVAGIIAAKQGNATGVSGVAPNVRILAVRVIGKCGGTTSDITDAIRWSAGGSVSGVPDNPNPADVINLSLGGTARCLSSFRSAIEFAQSRGVTVVAAAGNEGAPVSSAVPANCPGVISVVASNADGKRPNWSNYGTRSLPATITAPGESILSTYNSGRKGPSRPGYARASGTSMAAPVVSATVALLTSLGVSHDAMPRALASTTKAFGRAGSGQACNRTTCGAGLVSLAELVQFADVPTEPPTEPNPEPTPEPEAPPGPTPLAVPGLITDVELECRSGRKTALCTVVWSETRGAARVLYYEYRFKRGDRRWSKWRKVADARAKVSRLPLNTMSYFEVRGINEAGRGAVYQTAISPD